MPAGYTNLWVYKPHAGYTEIPLGWQFVIDIDADQLLADFCAVKVGSVPQRYLPQPDHVPFSP